MNPITSDSTISVSDDEDIWDIGPISVFFGLSNRIVNMSSMRTNEEFYLMGRIPRES